MTPQEQAQAALRQLMDAVLAYLADHPEGVTTREARDALGLQSPDLNDGRGDNLFWGLHNLLEREGTAVVRKNGSGRNIIVRVGQPTPTA